MGRNTMRSSVNNAMRQRLFTEYLNEQKESTMEYNTEQYFRLNIAKGREFMINSEYYGYSVKMNGKTYKYNHNFKTITK